MFFLSAHSISSTLINSIDNIVISGSLGLTATAIYGNYTYISTAILSIIIMIYRAMKSGIGNSLAIESKNENIKTFNALLFFCIWISAACSICLICLFQPFMKIWMGDGRLLDINTIIMIVLFFNTNSIRQFLTTIYIGSAGLWNKTLFRQILSTVINLILDIILIQKLGIFGVIMASFITNTFIALPLDIVDCL